jgi:hypothetical protein
MNQVRKAKARWWFWYWFGVLTIPLDGAYLLLVLLIRRLCGKCRVERKLTLWGVRESYWYLGKLDVAETVIAALERKTHAPTEALKREGR